MDWYRGKLTAPEFEQRFTDFIILQGGERVTDLLQKGKDAPLNADYLLWNRSVIAELKAISVDHFSDTNISEKLERLRRGWVHRGLMPLPPPGQSLISFGGLPISEQRKGVNAIYAHLQASIAKASRQIRSTRRVFNLPEAKGLVIIANLADRALLPETAFDALDYIFSQHQNGTFHSFVFLSPSVNHRSGDPAALWMSGSTSPPDGVNDELLSQLSKAWHSYTHDDAAVPIINVPAETLMNRSGRPHK